jgi:hypothetical protein
LKYIKEEYLSKGVAMKLIFTAIIASLIFLGCGNEIDNTPPKPPQGITTISLNNSVEIHWLPSQADDVKGYNVWVSDRYDGGYQLIGYTPETYFVHYNANNGDTYYYAVSALDFSNNESGLSVDEVHDTPRPEGYGVTLHDTATSIATSGYSFYFNAILSCYDIYTDFFFVNEGVGCYLEVWSNADIQDMGYTSSLDEISSSPTEGWAPSGTAEAIAGHTYVILTADSNYAKVRAVGVDDQHLIFDWAYQTAVGNPELKVSNLFKPRRNVKEHVSMKHVN